MKFLFLQLIVSYVNETEREMLLFNMCYLFVCVCGREGGGVTSLKHYEIYALKLKFDIICLENWYGNLCIKHMVKRGDVHLSVH